MKDTDVGSRTGRRKGKRERERAAVTMVRVRGILFWAKAQLGMFKGVSSSAQRTFIIYEVSPF